MPYEPKEVLLVLIYVATDTNETNSYVIAIAGTNSESLFDWLIEDGWVGTAVPWDETNPQAGKIALGTSVALQIVKFSQPCSPTPPHRTLR